MKRKFASWRTLAESADQVPRLSNGIPKIIHQTWKNEEVPANWKPSQDAWLKWHPDWIYCFWTDSDLNDQIREKHPEFWYVWTHFQQQIQRVDAIRYFLLKDIGGLQSDLDLMPNQSVNAYLEEAHADVLLVKSANEPCYTNMFMASRGPQKVSEDCLWTRMIRHMVHTHKNPKWQYLVSKHFQVMMTTGPLALTEAADSFTGSIAVLPKQRFNPFGILEAGALEDQEMQKYPVLYVLEGSSWHAWDSRAINFLLRQKWWMVTVGAITLFTLIALSLHVQNHQSILYNKLKWVIRHNATS